MERYTIAATAFLMSPNMPTYPKLPLQGYTIPQLDSYVDRILALG
jgi:hypothetical protein